MAQAGEPGLMPRRRGWAVWLGCLALAMLALVASDFVGHSLEQGWAGLTRDLSGENRLYWPDAPVATTAIFAHMIGGAVITALAPLQLAGPVRRRWPWVHRWSGRCLAACAVATGAAGLVYIGLRGTVGGAPMSVAFAVYGACLIVAAVMAARLARARDYVRHRRWALRLAILALASWIYRMHYGIVFVVADGAGVQDDFRGAFDLFNIWAFYVPYLIALELWFLRERRQPAPVSASG